MPSKQSLRPQYDLIIIETLLLTYHSKSESYCLSLQNNAPKKDAARGYTPGRASKFQNLHAPHELLSISNQANRMAKHTR